MDDRHAVYTQLLAGAEAGDREMLAQLEALIQVPIQAHQDAMDEAEANEAEFTRLARDNARIKDGFEAINATETRRIIRLAQGTLLLQLLVAALGLISWVSGPAKSAHGIHLDYYSAVAGITPLLLVAGFVELAVLGLRPAVWAVLSFAVPAIGAGGAALVVLATHDSTPYARFLTIWGLVATLTSLITYVVVHTTSSTPT
jgi:hypothetical protein